MGSEQRARPARNPPWLGHNSAMPILRFLAVLLCCALLASCATAPGPAPRTSTATVSSQTRPSEQVAERFVTQASPGDELDSIATWTRQDGQALVIATAKSSHRLVVYDGGSGERLRDVGGKGSGPGRFNRPNGVAVFADLVFVTERDARRVQVLSLPDFEPVGTFGEGQLRSPYGIWLHESAPGELQVYVTDSFMYGAEHTVVPPLAELDQRVRRYVVHLGAGGGFDAGYTGSFGDTSEAGALRMVESIWGDPAHDRLLVADEDRRHESILREYTLEGLFTGNSVPDGGFTGEAEGVVLWDCTAHDGYWIAVDQLVPLSVFHVYDRVTLAPRGSFRGALTANTDGIAVHLSPTPHFPGGVMYAVHDDRAVSAFDLRDVARALDLRPACGH